MATTGFIDRVDLLSFTERHGVVRSMTRKARVIFAKGTNPQDFTVLSQALTDAGVPAPMSRLTTPGYEALVLVERSSALAENDPCVVDVILKYEHLLEGPNQFLINPPGVPPFLFGKGRCSITEKTTNFFYPYGDTTAPRVQILTAHTYDLGDPALGGGTPLGPNFPNTSLQGGDINIPFPQGNFQLQGVIDVDNPWLVANDFIACVNDRRWLGKPSFTWICSEVQFDIDGENPNFGVVPGASARRYRFSFEFQYNVDTWYPTVVFNDQRTGRPPAKVLPATVATTYTNAAGKPYPVFNAVLNPLRPQINSSGIVDPGEPPILVPNIQPAGYWNVPALKPVDFMAKFGAFFEVPFLLDG